MRLRASLGPWALVISKALGAAVTALVLGCIGLWSPVRAAPEPPLRHRVQPGETVAELADLYGSTAPAIAAANLLSNPDLITTGRVLLIPPARAPVIPVEVGPADTLHSIARRHHTNTATLQKLNGMASGDRLWIGQDLLVPAPADQPSPALPLGPLAQVEVQPDPIPQGHTVLVRAVPQPGLVRANQPLSITLSLGDQSTIMRRAADGSYWGLLAIHALTDPGFQPVTLNWQTDSGLGTARWPVEVADADYETFNIVLPPGKGSLLDPQLVREEAEKLAAIWSLPPGDAEWLGLFIRPVPAEFPTSAPFGQRRSYNSGPVSSFHAGQDFAAPLSTPVLAPANGTVVLAEPLTVRGNAVIIDHGAGLFTGYWHLSSIAVSAGQRVEPETVLGLVGSTGLSTGAHLHWEMRLHGIAVSPMQWLSQGFS